MKARCKEFGSDNRHQMIKMRSRMKVRNNEISSISYDHAMLYVCFGGWVSRLYKSEVKVKDFKRGGM